MQKTPEKHTYQKKRQRGVVLFIALTVASLVLAIGVGILNVMTKEVILGSLSTRSRQAFYAADSGVECAMFWDFAWVIDNKHQQGTTYTTGVFATTTASVSQRNVGFVGSEAFNNTKFNQFCGGQPAINVFGTTDSSTSDYLRYLFDVTNVSEWNDNGTVGDTTDDYATTQFVFFPKTPTDINNPDITQPCALVTVEKQLIDGSSPPRISTTVYSEGFSSCDLNDHRRVSRGVMVEYEI